MTQIFAIKPKAVEAQLEFRKRYGFGNELLERFPGFRRKGIADLLLDRIIQDYSSSGMISLKHTPLKKEISNEKNYRGPLNLFKKKDFFVTKELDAYYIVRKDLNKI